MRERVSVLHVDDEPSILDLSTQLFERDDATVSLESDVSLETAGSGEEGMAVLADHDVDCLVSDSVRMPDGESFVEAASRVTDAPIVLFTAKEWSEVASDALAADIAGYVRKADPSDYKTVIRQVARLFDEDTSTDEHRHLVGYHDFSSRVELGVSIVEAVETVLGRDATELDPLYDAVDADVLESLFAPAVTQPGARRVEVRFTYEGLDLAVDADGRITAASLPS